MSHPVTNPASPSSSQLDPHSPPPVRRAPASEDPTDTLLTLRGLLTTTLAFRLPLSHFASFPDLIAGAHTAFGISEEECAVHFHKYRKVDDDGKIFCEEMSVFDHEDWPALLSCNMEEVVIWAHFIPLDRLNEDEGDEEDQIAGEKNVRFASEVHTKTFESTKPVVMKKNPKKEKKELNEDSTNIYSLCSPIPGERYGEAKYFSKEMVFIPDERATVPKPRLFPPKIAAPFPGFKAPVAPSTQPATTKAKVPAQSTEQAPAEAGFDYGAAVEEALRTAERIEYVSPPPLFPSQSLNPFDNIPDETPSAATLVPEEERVEEVQDETHSGSASREASNESDSIDNVFNDDWMVDSSASPSDDAEGLFMAEGDEAGVRRGGDNEHGESLFVPE